MPSLFSRERPFGTGDMHRCPKYSWNSSGASKAHGYKDVPALIEGCNDG
ncbi:MAG: hypothetical protein ACYDDV_10275 [Methanoregula sp.]